MNDQPIPMILTCPMYGTVSHGLCFVCSNARSGSESAGNQLVEVHPDSVGTVIAAKTRGK